MNIQLSELLLIEFLLTNQICVSAPQRSFTPGDFCTSNIHSPITHSCQVGLKCPLKVGQRLGIPLMGRVSVGIISHIYSISVCSGPLLSWSKPPQAKMMSRYRHTHSGERRVRCINVAFRECLGSWMCALFSLLPLITLILRLNSGLSHARGIWEVKDQTIPLLLAPKITVSSLNCRLRSIFPFSPSFSPH